MRVRISVVAKVANATGTWLRPERVCVCRFVLSVISQVGLGPYTLFPLQVYLSTAFHYKQKIREYRKDPWPWSTWLEQGPESGI